jgi:glycosyltransferase involved in cell wall biosynthesis
VSNACIIAVVKKLSVIMPVFNERATIEAIVAKVLAVPLPIELIVVDDRSSDGSWDALQALAAENRQIRLVRHQENRGKGAAIRTGFEHVTGDVVVIQDADLEYDPKEFPRLLAPIEDGLADVVYGSRFMGESRRVFRLTHAVANRFLTFLSNLVTGLNLTDMETCYKMFRADLIRNVRLTSERFGIEPELTSVFARKGVRIYEVPIGYAGRSYVAGKKIGVSDGIEAIWAIMKYNLLAPVSNRSRRSKSEDE